MQSYTQKAAALRYKKEQQSAPKVTAKGQGLLAEKIIEKAREFDVPLFQNSALADSLINLEVDEQIPPQLYEAVVEAFIWLQKTQQKAQMSYNG